MAHVVHADEAEELHLAGLAQDFDDCDVDAERDREVRGVVHARRFEPGLHPGRDPGAAVGRPGDFGERDGAFGEPLDGEPPGFELEVCLRRLEQVRGDRPRLIAHGLRREEDGRAPDRRPAAAARAEAVRDRARVAVDHGDVVGRDAELVSDDLGERGGCALAVG